MIKRKHLYFKKSKEGKIVNFVYENRRLKTNATKITDTVPEEKTTVQLEISTMENLVGIYQFPPFKIAITLEEETLYIQPEGSNKLPLTPVSLSTFIVAEIGAEITFKTLSNKEIEAALLIEGEIIIGLRKMK